MIVRAGLAQFHVAEDEPKERVGVKEQLHGMYSAKSFKWSSLQRRRSTSLHDRKRGWRFGLMSQACPLVVR